MASRADQERKISPASAVADPPVWIVGVGASGGSGVRDLRAFLGAWSPDSPAALMVVLHRNVTYRNGLREVLNDVSRIPVIVAHRGDPVRAGVCYLGESAEHLAVDKDRRVNLVPDHVYQTSSIDLLFRSLARYAPPRTIAVVLSGSRGDAAEGATAIRDAGGLVMTTLAEWRSMADDVMRRAGRPDFTGSPEAIAAEIARVVDC